MNYSREKNQSAQMLKQAISVRALKTVNPKNGEFCQFQFRFMFPKSSLTVPEANDAWHPREEGLLVDLHDHELRVHSEAESGAESSPHCELDQNNSYTYAMLMISYYLSYQTKILQIPVL